MTQDSPQIEFDFIPLGPYEEIRGRLESILQDDRFLYVDLSSGTLRFESGTAAAEICTDVLEGREGLLVSILRTTSPDVPVIVDVEEWDDSKISLGEYQTMRSAAKAYLKL